MTVEAEEGAFHGVRVVELAQWVFVPVAGALLADWGADVIHLEPLEGDPYRGLMTQGIGSDRGGVNLSMALANRGKRSLAIDVRHEKGRDVLEKLLGSADVFLTNLRPGALQRLGLDAETVAKRYPRLVYARGHGYGVRGPDANQAGYDASAFWARGGLAKILSPPDLDYPVGQRGAMGDRNGAMALAFGIAAALLKRERTGAGSVVDVSLLATAMWTLSSDVVSALDGNHPEPAAGRGPMPNPLVGTYRTSDGRHVQLVFLQPDRYWPQLCQLLGRPDLAEDPRFTDITVRRENKEACMAELDAEFGKRTFEEAKALLFGHDGRPRGPRCRPWGSCWTTRRCWPTAISATVKVDGDLDGLPAVPVQFDEQPPPMGGALPSTASTPSPSCSRSVTPGTTSPAMPRRRGARVTASARPRGPGPRRSVGSLLGGGGSRGPGDRPLRALPQLFASAGHRVSALPQHRARLRVHRGERPGVRQVLDRHAAVVSARVRGAVRSRGRRARRAAGAPPDRTAA